MKQEVAIQDSRAMEAMERSPADLIAQVRKINETMRAVMRSGEHYGVIPGTNKPTLLKPGAEKLLLLFRLAPDYESVDHYDGDHLTVKSKCTLYHIPTGSKLGTGEGSCSTKESKYAYRNANLVCPKCKKESIIKGKEEYGGGFLCFAKKGGCGAKFPDSQFEGVEIGKVPNEDLPDQYNTVLKMSNKRALVAAVLNTTGASDIFTQDIESEEDLRTANGDRLIRQQDYPKQPEPQKQAERVPEKHDHVLPGDAALYEKPEIMVTGLISKVEAKSGSKNGKEWTRYGITIEGEAYGTFDRKLGEFAESCKQNMSIVDLYWTQEGKFKTVEQITVKEIEEAFHPNKDVPF